MKIQTAKSISNILFLIVGILAILEFIFVKGMFTSLIVILLVSVVGIINIIIELIDKKYLVALHYLISSIALCMGYISLM